MIHLAEHEFDREVVLMDTFVRELAGTMVLGALLEDLNKRGLGFEMTAHWTQGEFHHDVVLQLGRANGTPPSGDVRRRQHQLRDCVLVVATNCNGGVKEVLALETVPERYGLWRWRCPHVADFSGAIPKVLARATTQHHFDPCELLKEDARSEILPEHRARQLGGGWELSKRCK